MPLRLRSSITLALLLAPSLIFGASGGRDDAFVPDPEPGGKRNIEEPREWTEGRVDLPPWPKDADLVEFRPDLPGTPFRFYIDGRNLRRDERTRWCATPWWQRARAAPATSPSRGSAAP